MPRSHHVLTLRPLFASTIKGTFRRQVIVLAEDELNARLIASKEAMSEGSDAWMSIRNSQHRKLAKTGKSRVLSSVIDAR